MSSSWYNPQMMSLADFRYVLLSLLCLNYERVGAKNKYVFCEAALFIFDSNQNIG